MLHMVLVTNLLEVKGRGPYLAFCSHALSLHLQALPSPDSLPSSAGAFSTSSTCSSSSSGGQPFPRRSWASDLTFPV